jgi:hypothetical protein
VDIGVNYAWNMNGTADVVDVFLCFLDSTSV